MAQLYLLLIRIRRSVALADAEPGAGIVIVIYIQ